MPNTSQTVPRVLGPRVVSTFLLHSLPPSRKFRRPKYEATTVAALAKASSHCLHISRYASTQPAYLPLPPLNLPLTRVYAGHSVVPAALGPTQDLPLRERNYSAATSTPPHRTRCSSTLTPPPRLAATNPSTPPTRLRPPPRPHHAAATSTHRKNLLANLR
ncbi:hypothetical protein EDB84DRAFT_1572494 [Lactarius hengduanensis]|nr:hypothetical protein EDB84DRAFT_1572494 [Lactarius hengduanensis]